jgi:hypothetical protein
MSFSIGRGAGGFSAAPGGGAGAVGGAVGCGAACGAVTVGTRAERAANGFIHCTKKNAPTAATAKSPIATTTENHDRRLRLGRVGAGRAASVRAGIETVGSPSFECGVVLMSCELR